MNIVLVNNNAADMTEFAQELMNVHQGLECLQFTDPLLSAKYIWNNPVDIVFAEERMRPVNGIELLRNIRRKKPELTVIILAEDESLREMAKDYSADEYWRKPVSREQLGTVLCDCMQTEIDTMTKHDL